MKTSRSFLAMLGFAIGLSLPSPAGAASADSLVLHYTFDKNSATTTFDSSPLGNHGALVGATPVASGISGLAMRFDGVDDYIRVPRADSLEPKEITVAAWVEIHQFRPNFGLLVHKRNGSFNNNEDYDLQIWENGTVRSVLANGEQSRLDSSTRMDRGTWHHVAMTFSEPLMKLYIDGALVGVKTHSLPLAHNPKSDLLIGATDHAAYPMDLFLNCDLDELRIYNAALSEKEIAELAGRKDHLVLHFTFDEGDKETVADSSSFGNDGLVFGAQPVAGGVAGRAMRFDGVDDFIRVPRSMSLEPAAITVATWLKVHEFHPDFGMFVHKRNTSQNNNEAYDLQVRKDGTIRSVVANGAQSRLDSPKPVERETWHHVAMVFAQPDLILYIDGAPVAKMAHPYPLVHNPTSDLLIGATDNATVPMSCFLNCDMDELRIYDIPLSASEIKELAVPPEAEKPGGLLVHYTFDKDEGGIVTDDSGNGRTAKVNGATWVADGARGGAYRFDGNKQTITATDAGLPSGAAPRTMAAWLKLDVDYSDTTTGMFTYGTFARNKVSGLGYDWRSGQRRLYFSPNGNCFLNDSDLPGRGTWIHVAYTYDGDEAHHLYVDGRPSDGMNELYEPLDTVLSGLLLLGGHVGSTGPDGGYLDDVRIYDRVLSAAEIAELAVPEEQSGDGLLVHYTFDKDEGDIVTDDSGNGRTAKVNGATWVADGARGGAYRFDSKTQTLTATDAGLPSGDAPRSVAAWMKLDVDYSDEKVTWMLSYGTAGFNLNDFVLGFDWRQDRDQFFFSPGGSCFLSERKVPAPGTWVHVAYTYGGNGAHHLFIDGQPSDGLSELWGPVDTLLSGVLLLGGHPESIGPDGGYLDDVRIYDRVLSAEEIAELAVPEEQSGGGLLVHYTFDKDEGGIVTDDSGNGRTAKVNGATWVADGARGGAYRFDSKTQTLTATDAGLPSGDAPRTMAAWMKLDVSYSNGVVGFLSYGTPGFDLNQSGLGFDWRLGRDCVQFSPGGSCFLSDRKLPAPGTWVHVAYTYEGNGAHHLFVDGQPADGMSELWGPVDTRLSGLLLMGGHPEAPAMDGGYLDDVRIYDRVLSAAEIAELASAPVDYPPIPEMNGIVRTTALDDGVEIRWASIPGKTYELLWASDLISGFSVIASNLVATGAEMSFTHQLFGAEPTGFYTIRIRE